MWRAGDSTTGHDAEPGADLLLVVGDGTVQTFELGDRELVIGRATDCDVAIDDRALSRRHAILRPGPPVTVQDLNSLNGTQVGAITHRGGEPFAVDATGFFVGGLAFVVVRRERDPVSVSSLDALLCVVDPTPAGVTPVVRDIAKSGTNVVIFGETGVGKEVLAATLHELSERTGPMTCINCAALSESLLASELFGHEKGAFTGAFAQKIGLLETADKGTVLLDEIGEMSLEIQTKLLRVIEQREVLRIGGTRPQPIDVRFVAATHRDLVAEVEAGRFRSDLFFRLHGVELVIPPLRDRRDVIPRLARQFFADARARANRSDLELDPSALAALEAHPWPGNVRELKATIERTALLARGPIISAKYLALTRRATARAPSTATESLAELALTGDQRLERARLVRVLEECGGNQSHAAKQLGISRTTMVTKLGFYRIKRRHA